MLDAGLNKTDSRHLSDYRPKGFLPGFGFAVLTLLLQIYALAGEFSQAAEFRTLTSSTIPWLLTFITLCLLVNTVGLWARSKAGLMVSIIALLGVSAGYVLWYVYSREILELLLSNPFYHQHPEAVPPHPLGIIGATRLNLLVLAMSGVLLVWETKTLHSRLRPQR